MIDKNNDPKKSIMVINPFKELKAYIATNTGVFLKPLYFISCGSLLWNYKITDFLTQMAQAQNV